MSARESLAAALMYHRVNETAEDRVVRDAARERLTQLPEPCANAWHRTRDFDPTSSPFFDECPTCHGEGFLYRPALVDLIVSEVWAKEFTAYGAPELGGCEFTPEEYREVVVAVLDALNLESQ